MIDFVVRAQAGVQLCAPERPGCSHANHNLQQRYERNRKAWQWRTCYQRIQLLCFGRQI